MKNTLIILLTLITALITPPAFAANHVVNSDVDGEYIKEWLVLGPFLPDNLETDLLADAGKEANIQPKEGDTIITKDGTTLTWKRYLSDEKSVNLIKAVGNYEHATAYAFCEIVSPKAQKTEMLVSGDDGVKIWCNGIQVHQFADLALDEDSVPVNLKRGKNRILVKVINEAGNWGFAIRFQDNERYLSSLSLSLSVKRREIDGKTALEILAGRQPKSNVWSLREIPIKVTVLDERKGQIAEFDVQAWQPYLWKSNADVKGDLTVFAVQADESGRQLSTFKTIEPLTTRTEGVWKTYRYVDGVADNWVLAINGDRKGNIWVGTLNGGVSRFDGQQWTTFTTRDGLASNLVDAIHGDREGNIWFRTYSNGVSRFDGEKWTTFTTEDGLADNRVRATGEDREGNIWFRSPFPESGRVSRFDGEQWTTFTTEDGLPRNEVKAIHVDREGNIWFAPWGRGVSKFNGEQWATFTTRVWGICEDREGNIWFRTNGGVSRFDGEKWIAFTIEDGLASNSVGEIKEDSKGNIWFRTNNGVSRFDGEKWITFTIEDGLASNLVRAIKEDREGNIWFGTNNGVSRFDGKQWTTFTTEDGLADNNVRGLAIEEDRKGNIWFGIWGKGVSRFDGKQWTTFTAEDGLPSNGVGTIYEDSKGNIWFGTYEGLGRYDGEHWTTFTTKDGLSNDDVISIHEDREGNILFGHESGGVSFFDGRCFQFINSQDGLINDTVRSIYGDKKGNIWIGTDEGVVRFTRNKVAPLIEIKEIIADKTYDNPKGDIRLPANISSISFRFSSISFKTLPGRIRYFYQLVGYDTDWQGSTNQETIQYFNLKSGKYTFKVQAVDRDLNYSEPAMLTFEVKRPWLVYGFIGVIGTLLPLIAIGFYVGKRLQTQRAIAQQFNPYIAGRVVGEDMFYGRSDLITDIERTLHNNCFLLYGERRIGKTSLQHQLAERLSNADDPTYKFIPAYIDLQGVAEDDFFRTIATGIVEHAASLFESPNGQADRSTEDPLPLRLNEARDQYSYRYFTRDLRTIIDHLKEGETKTIKLVLLMDEIDTLNEYSLRTNLNLRGLFMGPFKENLVLVMSGLYLKMDWSEEGGGSPPFNFLSREIQLEPLDEDSARKLVTEPVKGFYSYESEAVNLIIEYSELKPFTIQGFCLRAVARILADGRTKITVDDIKAIKDSVLAELSSIRGERAGTSLPGSLNEALSRITDLEAELARIREDTK